MKKIIVFFLILIFLLTFTGVVVADFVSDKNGLGDINGGPVDNGVKETDLFGILVSFTVLGVLLLVLFLANKNLLPKTKKEKLLKLREGQNPEELNLYAKQVLGLLKKRGNGLTQNEIRAELSEISEAKISIIIAELEYMGKIKKIKKARGSIIFLKGQ